MGGIRTYLDESGVFNFKAFQHFQGDICCHDLCETGCFTSFFLHFAEEHCVCLLIKYSPRLSTTMRSRPIHQYLRKLYLFSGNILVEQSVFIFLLGVAYFLVNQGILLTFSVATLSCGSSSLVFALLRDGICLQNLSASLRNRVIVAFSVSSLVVGIIYYIVGV